MGKSLYSLILSDEVIRKIDVLAHRSGTNRSNYINQILAEHASITTPERRINDIFGLINEFFGNGEIVPNYIPNQTSMSLKSCLEYRYRPTMRYEVELFNTKYKSAVGKLDLQFRTTSSELLDKLVEFFKLWVSIEGRTLSTVHEYELIDGKFSRSICIDEVADYQSNELASAISEYVKFFDNSLKSYVAGSKSPEDINEEYLMFCKNAKILI